MKLLLSVLFLLAFISNAHANSFPTPEQFAQEMDKLVPESVDQSTPGLVVGVYHDGKLLYGKSYGIANLSHQIPNSIDLNYNIGSVTKQFMGYAFAMLHVQNKLSIDDPVHQYLDDWPTFEHTVTLRHLLTHTSGYREAYTLSDLAGRYIGIDRLTREECLEVIRRQPKLEFTPGSKFVYNSTAWVVLAEVLEKVTGQPSDKWVSDNIFHPLGMKNTQIESFVGEVITDSAESYSLTEDKEFENTKSNRAIFGASDIYVGIKDLAPWIHNMKTAQLGGEKVRDLFLNQFQFNDGSYSDYALGISIEHYRGLRRIRHTGSHESFITQLSYYPEQDLGIVVISNFGGRGYIPSSKIADFLLAQYMDSSEDLEASFSGVSPSQLKSFTGLYVSQLMNRKLQIEIKNQQLTIDDRHVLTQISDKKFKIKGRKGEFVFRRTENAEHSIYATNSKETFYRAKEWQPKATELKPYEGKYWSKELETLYQIKVKEGKLNLSHRWLGEKPLTPITKDLFHFKWDIYFQFRRENEKDIKEISINSSRSFDIIFSRQNLAF